MNRYKPYKISHINLALDQDLPELSTVSQGNYIVFWWNDIALGDWYLQPAIKITGDIYFERLTASIKKGVEYYSAKHNLRGANWQQWLKEKDFKKWNAWMDTIFSYPENIPQKAEVSVIVCTRNRAQHLNNCLKALQQLSCLPKEIIVIDNAPTDTTTQDVVKRFSNVIYVREDRPGLDIARNTGVKTASMPVVAFVDDDVAVHQHLIYHVWQTFQDEQIHAMTGLVIAAELLTEAQYIFEKYWSFNRGYIDKYYDKNYFEKTLAKGPPVWEIGAGANTAFRKNVFNIAGYFDERLDVGAAGCNGDSEMWYRILAAGKTIHYNPRAIVYHEHRREMPHLKSQLFNYMRGFAAAAMIQQKHEPKAGYKHHLFVNLPKYYLRLLLKGFPGYRLRYSSLWVEVKGVLSGLNYYRQHKNA